MLGILLVKRKKIANVAAQKSDVKHVFGGAQLLSSTMLEHAEKHHVASGALLEEVDVDRDDLDIAEVQAIIVIVGLETAEAEASGVPKEVMSEFIAEENLATSYTLQTDMTCINLNSISNGGLDYSILNHISPTPSQYPSPNQSLKHTSSPVG